MTTQPDLAALRRLLDAATPRPWSTVSGAGNVWHFPEEGTPTVVAGHQRAPRVPDAILIAAAVNALPALLDAAAERDALAARLAAAEVEARAQAERAVHAEKQADHETRVAVHLAGVVSGLRAKVERVRALHRAVGIYAECDCADADPATHLNVDDVGLTCNLLYRVCAECCRDDVYQTEDCANYHDHRLGEDYHCPTVRALDEEPQP